MTARGAGDYARELARLEGELRALERWTTLARNARRDAALSRAWATRAWWDVRALGAWALRGAASITRAAVDATHDAHAEELIHRAVDVVDAARALLLATLPADVRPPPPPVRPLSPPFPGERPGRREAVEELAGALLLATERLANAATADHVRRAARRAREAPPGDTLGALEALAGAAGAAASALHLAGVVVSYATPRRVPLDGPAGEHAREALTILRALLPALEALAGDTADAPVP